MSKKGFETIPREMSKVRRRYEGMEEDALQAPRANQIYQQQPGWFSRREHFELLHGQAGIPATAR